MALTWGGWMSTPIEELRKRLYGEPPPAEDDPVQSWNRVDPQYLLMSMRTRLGYGEGSIEDDILGDWESPASSFFGEEWQSPIHMQERPPTTIRERALDGEFGEEIAEMERAAPDRSPEGPWDIEREFFAKKLIFPEGLTTTQALVHHAGFGVWVGGNKLGTFFGFQSEEDLQENLASLERSWREAPKWIRKLKQMHDVAVDRTVSEIKSPHMRDVTRILVNYTPKMLSGMMGVPGLLDTSLKKTAGAETKLGKYALEPAAAGFSYFAALHKLREISPIKFTAKRGMGKLKKTAMEVGNLLHDALLAATITEMQEEGPDYKRFLANAASYTAIIGASIPIRRGLQQALINVPIGKFLKNMEGTGTFSKAIGRVLGAPGYIGRYLLVERADDWVESVFENAWWALRHRPEGVTFFEAFFSALPWSLVSNYIQESAGGMFGGGMSPQQEQMLENWRKDLAKRAHEVPAKIALTELERRALERYEGIVNTPWQFRALVDGEAKMPKEVMENITILGFRSDLRKLIRAPKGMSVVPAAKVDESKLKELSVEKGDEVYTKVVENGEELWVKGRVVQEQTKGKALVIDVPGFGPVATNKAWQMSKEAAERVVPKDISGDETYTIGLTDLAQVERVLRDGVAVGDILGITDEGKEVTREFPFVVELEGVKPKTGMGGARGQQQAKTSVKPIIKSISVAEEFSEGRVGILAKLAPLLSALEEEHGIKKPDVLVESGEWRDKLDEGSPAKALAARADKLYKQLETATEMGLEPSMERSLKDQVLDLIRHYAVSADLITTGLNDVGEVEAREVEHYEFGEEGEIKPSVAATDAAKVRAANREISLEEAQEWLAEEEGDRLGLIKARHKKLQEDDIDRAADLRDQVEEEEIYAEPDLDALEEQLEELHRMEEEEDEQGADEIRRNLEEGFGGTFRSRRDRRVDEVSRDDGQAWDAALSALDADAVGGEGVVRLPWNDERVPELLRQTFEELRELIPEWAWEMMPDISFVFMEYLDDEAREYYEDANGLFQGEPFGNGTVIFRNDRIPPKRTSKHELLHWGEMYQLIKPWRISALVDAYMERIRRTLRERSVFNQRAADDPRIQEIVRFLEGASKDRRQAKGLVIKALNEKETYQFFTLIARQDGLSGVAVLSTMVYDLFRSSGMLHLLPRSLSRKMLGEIFAYAAEELKDQEFTDLFFRDPMDRIRYMQTGVGWRDTLRRASEFWAQQTKMVDEQGNLKVFYHGTPWVYDEADPSRSPGGMYGAGFYSTNTGEMTGGYALAIEQGLRRLRKEVAAIDKQLARPEDYPAAYLEQRRKEKRELERQIAIDTKAKDPNYVYGPNTRIHYLDIRRPFTIEKQLTDEDFNDLGRALEELSQFHKSISARVWRTYEHAARMMRMVPKRLVEQRLKEKTGEAVWRYLEQELGNHKFVTEVLQRAGFDGITHEGGKMSGGERHEVSIVWKASQVHPVFRTAVEDLDVRYKQRSDEFPSQAEWERLSKWIHDTEGHTKLDWDSPEWPEPFRRVLDLIKTFIPKELHKELPPIELWEPVFAKGFPSILQLTGAAAIFQTGEEGPGLIGVNGIHNFLWRPLVHEVVHWGDSNRFVSRKALTEAIEGYSQEVVQSLERDSDRSVWEPEVDHLKLEMEGARTVRELIGAVSNFLNNMGFVSRMVFQASRGGFSATGAVFALAYRAIMDTPAIFTLRDELVGMEDYHVWRTLTSELASYAISEGHETSLPGIFKNKQLPNRSYGKWPMGVRLLRAERPPITPAAELAAIRYGVDVTQLAPGKKGMVTLTQVRKAAKEKFELVVDELVETMLNAKGKVLPEIDPADTEAPIPGLGKRAKKGLLLYHWNMYRPERIMEMLDGHERGGHWHQLWKPLSDASDAEPIAIRAHTESLKGKMKELGIEAGHAFSVEEPVTEELTLTKTSKLEVWLAAQDPYKKLYLTEVMGFKDEHIDAVTRAVEEDKPLHQLGQWMLDWYKKQWPRIAAVHFLMTGKILPRVSNYSPIATVTRMATHDLDISERMLNEHVQGRKDVEKGMTELRKGPKDKLILDALTNFVHNAARFEHYIHFALPTRQVRRIIANKKWQHALDTAYGEELFGVLRRWVDDTTGTGPAKGSDLVGRVTDFCRRNAAVSMIGFNVLSMLRAPLSFLHAMGEMGPKGITYAMKAWEKVFMDSEETLAFIYSKSPWIEHRFAERELREHVEALSVKERLSDRVTWKSIQTTATKPYQWIDKKTVAAAWLARYNQASDEGLSDKQAVEEADVLIRKTQPQARTADLPGFWRGGPVARLFTMFQNMVSQNYNLLVHDIVGATGRKKQSVGKGLWKWILEFLLPGYLMGVISRGRLPTSREAMAEMSAYHLSPWFGAGYILSSRIKGYNEFQLAPLSWAEDTFRALSAKSWTTRAKWGVRAMMKLTGIPVNQPFRTIQGAINLADGRTDSLRSLVWSPYQMKPDYVTVDAYILGSAFNVPFKELPRSTEGNLVGLEDVKRWLRSRGIQAPADLLPQRKKKKRKRGRSTIGTGNPFLP